MARQKTPTALAIVRNNPGKRPINKREPKVKRVTTRAPKGLSGEALAMWKEFSKELHRLGMLDLFNRRALELACLCWATSREEFAKGNYSQAERMNTAYRQWCCKFGFTPSDKAGMVLPDDDEKKNPFAGY